MESEAISGGDFRDDVTIAVGTRYIEIYDNSIAYPLHPQENILYFQARTRRRGIRGRFGTNSTLQA
jgi:hypothetical protein